MGHCSQHLAYDLTGSSKQPFKACTSITPMLQVGKRRKTEGKGRRALQDKAAFTPESDKSDVCLCIREASERGRVQAEVQWLSNFSEHLTPALGTLAKSHAQSSTVIQ